MLKARFWIGVCSTPILLASAGCSMGQRPLASTNHALPPDRLMSMARTFERQGHLSQAKTAYQQVLAANPAYPNARQSLDTLIASEMNQNRRGNGSPFKQPNQALAQSRLTRDFESSKLAKLQPATSAAKRAELLAESDLPPSPLGAETGKVIISTNEPPATSLTEVAISLEPVDSAEQDSGGTVVDSQQLASVESSVDSGPGSAVAQESDEFFEPREEGLQIVSAELEPYFGTFTVELVDRLKSDRERLEPLLAQVAVNPKTDIEVRSRAVFLLGAIGPDAAEVVPMLRGQMHGEIDNFLRVDVAEAILKIQPEDHDAIAVLVECLTEPDKNLRWVAAFSLRNAVSPRTTFVIDSLKDVLQTDDLKLRRMVFLTLAEFGPAAVSVVPELEVALDSEDPATREVARASLACIVPDHRTTQIQSSSYRGEIDPGQ